MENSEIYISHVLETNSGFGARTDTGEQVFIPASVVKASRVVEGDIVAGKLIPNSHPNNQATPWVVVHVTKNLEPEKEDVAPSIDILVMKAVDALGYGSTAEVAREAGADGTTTGNALNRLFKAGTVAKALVYARADQDRPSFCMWADNTSRFLE
jgi:hypothetical protein